MQREGLPLLSLLIWSPAVGALLVAVFPDRWRTPRRIAAWAAMAVSLAAFFFIAAGFEKGTAEFQFVEDFPWAPAISSRYLLGIDGISLLMVGLTVLLFPISILSTTGSIKEGERAYLALLLILETAILGAFLALDLLVFFVFWEAVLVPMYFLIAGWGSDRRSYAAVKFFLYTMFGSAFLLVGIVYLAVINAQDTGVLTFDVRLLQNAQLTKLTQVALFAAFGAGFAVKIPVFPLHTWLPDAHTEAPTAGSVILAGVLLKLGVYGFLRFSLPLFPEGARELLPVFVVLGLVGIVYGAVVSVVQKDLKRLVAYSSVSHLGFSVVGIFVLTLQGFQGGLLQMFNHGVSTGALFLLVGMIYDRLHTRRIEDMGGIWSAMPVFSGLFLITALASIGLPGLGGFVGEFLVLAGSFLRDPVVAAVAGLGVILSAVYLLWAYQRVFTGELGPKVVPETRDVGVREIAAMVPLVALMFFVGLYPKPLIERSEPSLRKVVDVVSVQADVSRPDLEVPAPVSGDAFATTTGREVTHPEEGSE
jgi:NADH-quinone oxidoreductase subunit M